MLQAARALIVAGPTCGGKSALAIEAARRLGGTIINADAMQVYRDLRVLTARPSAAEERQAPHRLYGVRDAACPGSAAWWRGAALAAMAEARAAGRLPILCGGTGLYFEALRHGLAAIPDPGAAARAEARSLLAAEGAAALHARLAAVDPATAARLGPGDGQRVARAYEVWRGTGRGLAAWQGTPRPPLAEWRFRAVRLAPPREALRRAAAARFDAMLRGGALDEVRALIARGLDPALPAMRALGVPPLIRHLRGEATLAAARDAAVASTGQYIKRQETWFGRRGLADPSDTHTIHARYEDLTQFSESLRASLLSFLHASG